MIAAKPIMSHTKGLSKAFLQNGRVTSFGCRQLPPTVGAVMLSTSDSPHSLTCRHNTTSSKSYARASSTSAQTSDQRLQQQPGFHPIYVHHVSRVALEHLQDNRSDWLVARGLHRNLQICKNGTFILKFPEYGRIWTSYDSIKRQHWLSVSRNELAVRFLLKDHDKAAMALLQQPHKMQEYQLMSVRRIQQAIDEMIKSVDKSDAKKLAMENETTSS
ncbi:hypothetical protein IV203_007100 [Nitzschia inconspicua]|uniref:Uncharacterized protein n=1 Tax=Nitzschia inconspicua TaxID=303405 RepID=A0A9K3KE97_9STRA|nr:hypothetical protein IV203_007100 [Nitzschia inconspicua]